ncbi:carboxyl-terminal processing protease [Caenispirillum bisanense]|uniref:Carboxyl-terminal processing protease n=2 Tax=Caenispirillum bisanense TaxID=414052 RepID=A0A286G2I9_9PROT|nr:carboxyl-terminal processing protease [Caenispirillum bisanense]
MSFRQKMTRPAHRIKRTALVVAALTAAACAPSEGPTSSAVAAGPVPSAPHAVDRSDGFAVREAERVFSYAFDAITDRYIDGVTARGVAVEGLRGLGSIDPAVAVEVEGGRAEIRTPAGLLASVAAPADDDARGWARAVTELIAGARGTSPQLAAAGREDIYEAVFDATLAKLDMFSRYAGAEEARDHRASRNGFGGIGIRYVKNEDGLLVKDVFEDAPSDGLLFVDDVIVGVAGTPTVDLETKQIKDLLRGPIDSSVTLSVKRTGIDQPVQVPIRRALVVPRTVTLTLDHDVAVIKISSFNQRTASGVDTAVRQARAGLGASLRGIVLDLRGNPGGLLDQAVAVSDLFLTDGPIVSTRGRHPESRQAYAAREDDVAAGLPVVVLVDGRSASSAEIVTAALQDRGRAVVVGTTSYGKGTVQTVVRLPNDGELTLTWSRFHSPSGYALHGLGVMPALCTATADSAPQVAEAPGTAHEDDDAVVPVTHSDVPAAGEDAGRTVEKLIASRAAAAGSVPTQYAQWRSTPIEDTEGRKRLRTACPPVNHADSTVDLAVGERLIEDRGLYSWALGLTHGADTAAR